MKEKSSRQKAQTPLFHEIEKELEKYRETLNGEIEQQKKEIEIKRSEALERVEQMAYTTLEEVRSEWKDYEKKIELFRQEQEAKLEHWFTQINKEIERSSLIPSLVTESITYLCQVSDKQERSN